mmetsp:Transcript_14282/g.23641  ORF Transcript_14282/g.23641 Transcript_14282/m.23641 type:complete len:414 (+) Transcript_14282:56-1297(+)|eukprot:CAMPEP_0114429888 /NCGR_PEP_ID=MMETSP0103-20121206/9736_1 /TAXON_ID=37642 ORGANISM="Paraphysomonas imperforata, Strain PA2" /NCGR_SAMPLE_ID=MMETSP0103 /ASSEMBLY_ACC=CAM_ASM_000201 /LENGTH=413 /DNA_ID=CAMNT_0001599275 /DNA_START=30 /DNA_END=1271 /DNA_ORIENTATION=-
MKRRVVTKEVMEEVAVPRSNCSTTTTVANDETKMQKIVTRTAAGCVMALVLALILRGGALYCIIFGIVTQVELFRELTNVRYVEAKEKSTPLFRTLQWSWFILAMFFTYGESFHNFCLRHGHMVHITEVTQHLDVAVFSLYCLLFIVTVLTFKRGLIRFQISQLVWTLVTVALVVLQTKFMAQCTLQGIFWFFFPMAAVGANDVFAYICGMTCGKKFIQAPFLSISPKKTWEGFIGAAFFTCLFSFYFPLLLADSPWFTCPVEKLTFIPLPISDVTCSPHSIFLPHEYMIPDHFGGAEVHSVELRPIQLHGLAYGLFASLVAPFGGFLASAIKRGYDIKDFDKIIPGHGGMMDRMDCQLIIHLFTYIHLTSFVIHKTSLVGVGDIVSAAAVLSPDDLARVHRELSALLAVQVS